MNFIKQNFLAILIIVFLGVSAVISNNAKFGVAANVTTFTNPLIFSSSTGVKFSTSGTAVVGVNFGTCTAIVYASLAATSSQRADCVATGAASGDKVIVMLPQAARASANDNFIIAGASASSTAGYISFNLYNMTGVATSSYPLATTSVQYFLFR